MTKLYRQPVQVQSFPDGRPLAFRWRRRWYRVVSCEEKDDGRPAWLKELPMYAAGPQRYRCVTADGMVCELERGKDGWVLERVWD